MEDGQEEGRDGGLPAGRDSGEAVRSELERIADLLTEAAGALRRLAGNLSTPPVPAPGEQREAAEPVEEAAGAEGSAPEALPERGDPPPFLEEIMPAAARVLRAEPGRVWQSGDLTRKVLEEAGAGDREDIRWSGDLPFFLTRRLAVRGFLERFGEDRYRVPAEPQGAEDEAGGMRAEVVRLEQEIDTSRRYLPTLDRRERTSQVALWAGQARALQDRADRFDEAWATRLRRVFGRLSSIIREQDCGWVSALNREWETDWEVYTAIHRGILNSMPPYLDVEQEAAYCRDELEALFFEGRHVERSESDALLLDALGVLPEDDELLQKALEQFGDPRRPVGAAASTSAGIGEESGGGKPSVLEKSRPAEEVEVPADVVAYTSGLRVLIVGGQGAREEQRRRLEQVFEMEGLDWITVERNQVLPYSRAAERVLGGRYDLVIYLAVFSSHSGGIVVDACRHARVPILFLTSGYNPTMVAYEIGRQLLGSS